MLPQKYLDGPLGATYFEKYTLKPFAGLNRDRGTTNKVSDLITFLKENNFDIVPELDGKLHRFDRAGEQTGWFVGREYQRENAPSFIWAKCGDWKEGVKFEFTSNIKFASKEEEKQIRAKFKEDQKRQKEEAEKEQQHTAKISERRWNELNELGESAYLKRKDCEGVFGQRYGSGGSIPSIYIPCRDHTGKLWGLQKIQDDGTKFFTPQQKIEGCFHLIGEIKNKIYLCEGFATAVSIYKATETATVCAFNAGNLKNVAKALKSKYSHASIIVCCDNDQWTEVNGKPKNVGVEAGREAASQVSGMIAVPHFTSPQKGLTDFNDLAQVEGLEVVKEQLEKAFTYIPSEFDGFHAKELRGNRIVLIPQYEDLRRFFERTYNYKTHAESGLTFVWNGKQYEVLNDKFIEAFAQQHFIPTADNKMVREFTGIVGRHNLKSGRWFEETTKRKINFQNAVLDLDGMKLLEQSPEMGFRYTLNYDFDPNATCPVFDKFLKDITMGDDELAQVILEFVGYAISGDTCWAQKALVLEGEGENGKSTLITVIQWLVGKGNYSTNTLSSLKNDNKASLMDGKLLNVAEETPSKSLEESSTFKNLVSGGETTGKKLYKDTYTFRNRAKLIFACNRLPVTQDTTHGYFRRFLIIPFRQEFSDKKGNKDPHIETKLKDELSGIFNKVIKAYQQLCSQQRFTHAKASRQALEEYQEEIDPVRTFVKENMIFHPLGNGHDEITIPFTKMYESYKTKCEREGYKPITFRLFMKAARTLVPDFHQRHKRTGKYKVHSIIGELLSEVNY